MNKCRRNAIAVKLLIFWGGLNIAPSRTADFTAAYGYTVDEVEECIESIRQERIRRSEERRKKSQPLPTDWMKDDAAGKLGHF